MVTSYSRRQGPYVYDIEVHEAVQPAKLGRFYARVVNMMRRESGQTTSVHAEFEHEYGATPDEAVTRIEAVVKAWVTDQT